MNTQTVTTSNTTTTLKLSVAQALRRVKKLKGNLKEHEQRASQSVSYIREGNPPVFKFTEQRALRDRAREELVRLEAAIACSNGMTKVTVEGREMFVAEAIRRLQEFKAEIAWLSSLQIREGTTTDSEVEYDEATGRNVRRPHTVVHVTELKEIERVHEIEALRARFEALNDAVETANHRTMMEVELVTAPSSPAG